MKLGERTHGGTTWSFASDNPSYFSLSPNKATTNASADDCSLFFNTNSFTASQCYSSSNTNASVGQFQSPDSDNNGCSDFLSVDAHSCDNFHMFEFKVRMCPFGRSHDWMDCPLAHPGEKARRRDPRKFQYSGIACPEFRRGNCRQGDACEFAHGVFECWLHPARYRTLPCKDSMNCKRRVCFFAHSPDQLRVVIPVAESHKSSPEFKYLQTESPPIPPMSANSVKEMVACLRQLQLNKVKSNMPSSWTGSQAKMTLPGYLSLPTTPTRKVSRLGIGSYFDTQFWEEPVMERVESGRDLRARMLEKLSKENPLDWVDPVPNPNPDPGWVSELIK